MFSVSDNYKIDMQSQVRNESYVEIAHVIPNHHNVGEITPTVYPTGLFENEPNQYFIAQVQGATFEPMGCVLDGTTYLRGDPTVVSNNALDEYVSPIISSPTITNPPASTVFEFDTGLSVTELSDSVTDLNFEVSGHSYIINTYFSDLSNKPEQIFLKFDSFDRVRPTAFTINMKDEYGAILGSGTATANYTVTQNSATYNLPTVSDYDASYIAQIEIVVTALNMPYAYVRIEKVILGIVNEFTDADISGCEWNVTANPLTFEVPLASFDFTFLDVDRLYHESNPNTLINDIRENQQVGFRFGYQLESGGTEWVNCGLYRTTGNVTTEDTGIPRVTIKTAHASVNADELVRELDPTLVSLTEDEEVAVNINNVVDLMDTIGVTATIDSVSSGTNFSPTVTVIDPNVTLKEYAQMISNAYGLMWTVKRDSAYTEEMVLTEFAKLVRNATDNYDTITVHVEGRPDGTIGLFDNNVYDSDGVYLFQFNNSTLYSPPNIKTVPKSDGIDYARYNIDTNETERATYPVSPTGTRLIKIDNPMVTTQGSPSTTTNPNTKFGEYISDYYGEMKTYVLSNRGFPELDVGDIVQIYADYYDIDGETVLFQLIVQGMIVGNRISYNGSMKGETTVIGWETLTGKNVMVDDVLTYVAGKYR